MIRSTTDEKVVSDDFTRTEVSIRFEEAEEWKLRCRLLVGGGCHHT